MSKVFEMFTEARRQFHEKAVGQHVDHSLKPHQELAAAAEQTLKSLYLVSGQLLDHYATEEALGGHSATEALLANANDRLTFIHTMDMSLKKILGKEQLSSLPPMPSDVLGNTATGGGELLEFMYSVRNLETPEYYDARQLIRGLTIIATLRADAVSRNMLHDVSGHSASMLKASKTGGKAQLAGPVLRENYDPSEWDATLDEMKKATGEAIARLNKQQGNEIVLGEDKIAGLIDRHVESVPQSLEEVRNPFLRDEIPDPPEPEAKKLAEPGPKAEAVLRSRDPDAQQKR